MSVLWVGESEIWNKPTIKDRFSTFALPLVEESVLDVAFNNSYVGMKRLSTKAAVNCTSRLALRVALASTGLNPEWSPFSWKPGVVKAPASCANNGVRFFENTEHTDLLQHYAPELAKFGVTEEFIGGRAFELDGFVSEHWHDTFFPLEQFWEGDKIVEYKRIEPPLGLLAATDGAIQALGLRNCCFCFEFRRKGKQWKIIDAHARLGEDRGLAEKMWDGCPLARVEKEIR